jgi:hypothetical protein
MKWVCALLLIGATGAASAQSADDQRGFYLGAVGGVTTYPKHPKVVFRDYTLHSTDTREEDFSWGVTAGYRFGRHFALEAGYIDLGAGTAKLIDTGGTDFRGDLRLGVRGPTIAAVALFPFGPRWEMFLKGGALYQDVKVQLDWTQSGVAWTLGATAEHELRPFVEGGVSYRFDSHWKAGLGMSFFRHLGTRDRTGEVNLRSSFLGMTYQF